MTARQLPPVVPATTLRVYEPLEAFSISERPALEVLALREGADRRAHEAERMASWRAVLAGRGAVVPGPDGAIPAPWPAADQVPVSDRSDRSDRSDQAGGGPVDDAPAGRADLGRADGGARGGPGKGYVATRVLRVGGVLLVCPLARDEPLGPGGVRPPRRLVRSWALPEAWLTLVRPEDKVATKPQEGGCGTGGGRYEVAMSSARSRAARALKTLRLGLGETEFTAEVEIMARWLETFHPRAWVELDTRAVARLAGGEDGADDVAMGLECLASGDPTGAAAAYHRLTSRQRLLDDLSRSS